MGDDVCWTRAEQIMWKMKASKYENNTDLEVLLYIPFSVSFFSCWGQAGVGVESILLLAANNIRVAENIYGRHTLCYWHDPPESGYEGTFGCAAQSWLPRHLVLAYTGEIMYQKYINTVHLDRHTLQLQHPQWDFGFGCTFARTWQQKVRRLLPFSQALWQALKVI